MSEKLKRRVRVTMDAVRKEIAANAAGGGFAAGLANEGYAGGYLAALNDVLLAMNDVPPNGRYDLAWRAAFAAKTSRKKKES